MLAHTDPRLVRLYRPLVTSFLENDQFSGFAGSAAPSKSTIAPSLESLGLTCAAVEGDCGEAFSGGDNSVIQIMIIIEVYSLHCRDIHHNQGTKISPMWGRQTPAWHLPVVP